MIPIPAFAQKRRKPFPENESLQITHFWVFFFKKNNTTSNNGFIFFSEKQKSGKIKRLFFCKKKNIILTNPVFQFLLNPF